MFIGRSMAEIYIHALMFLAGGGLWMWGEKGKLCHTVLGRAMLTHAPALMALP